MTGPPRREALLALLAERVALRTGVDPGEVDALAPLAELGLDSVELVSISGELEEELGVALPPELLAEQPDLHSVAAALEARLLRPVEPEPPAIAALGAELARLEDSPFGLVASGLGPLVEVEGREAISFASYDYLGLNGDPEVSAAAKAAIDAGGTSPGASRVAGGERPIHRELERELARFLGVEDALAYVSGHATNVSTIAALVGPGDLVLHDALAHDSVLQGCRLSRAASASFPHDDHAQLDRILARRRPQHRRALVVIEAVYSAEGGRSPELRRFVEVCRRHAAWLMVDEAHALGVLGPTGRGLAEAQGVDPREVQVWMGTLSKALVACGGYIAGEAALVSYLRHRSSGFVFSVGLSPPLAAAALAALRKLEAEPGRVARLRERTELFLRLGRERGLPLEGGPPAAVVVLRTGDERGCLRLARALRERGVLASPMIHPAVPRDGARLRFFVTAAHTPAQIERAVEALAAAR